MRARPGWNNINLERDGRLHLTRALVPAICLAGFRLLVGRDVQDRAEVRALIVNSLIWASLGATILAVFGGLLMRRAVLARVEIINRTASAIVSGDFSRRVPTQGSSDEFDQLAVTVNAMLEQIERLVEGVRNASNVVAHDLRTPLAELRTRLETLLRAPPRSRMRKFNRPSAISTASSRCSTRCCVWPKSIPACAAPVSARSI